MKKHQLFTLLALALGVTCGVIYRHCIADQKPYALKYRAQAQAVEAIHQIPQEVTMALIDMATEGGQINTDSTNNLFGIRQADTIVQFTFPAGSIFMYTEMMYNKLDRPAVDDTSSFNWAAFLYKNKVISSPDHFSVFHQRYLPYRTNTLKNE